MSAVAAGVSDTAVPSCPDWTVGDLVEHLTAVYLHKVECMRSGAFPDDWPPGDGLDAHLDRIEEAGDLGRGAVTSSKQAELRRFDRTARVLCREFETREVSDETATFYPHDRTVGFWLRRMAQETAIHRYDAELAVGATTPIVEDIAADGIDEMLTIFVGWELTEEADDPEVAPVLADADEHTVTAIRAGTDAYVLRASTAGVGVSKEAPDAEPDGQALTVSGDPAAVLLWLWNRTGDDAVRIDGSRQVRDHLNRILTLAGQ